MVRKISICWKFGSMLGFVKFMVYILLSWFNISICCESEVGMNNGVLIFISKLLACEVLYACLGMEIVVSCAIQITTSWAVRLDACVRWFSLLLYLAWGLTPQDRYRLDGIVLRVRLHRCIVSGCSSAVWGCNWWRLYCGHELHGTPARGCAIDL